jgi:hypothetical protein
MRVRLALAGLAVVMASVLVAAQARRATAGTRTEAPEMVCPTPLGAGASTGLAFCDVLIGRDPATGIVITIPPHRGQTTLTFDLHNRETYSEERMADPRTAFARHTASIGTLTLDNTLISRSVVQSEFRSGDDLLDRITGGAGPSGLKAVAPTGTQSVRIMIPEAETKVSILGEKLTVDRADGSVTYTSIGRPIAIISNVMIEYRPRTTGRRR